MSAQYCVLLIVDSVDEENLLEIVTEKGMRTKAKVRISTDDCESRWEDVWVEYRVWRIENGA